MNKMIVINFVLVVGGILVAVPLLGNQFNKPTVDAAMSMNHLQGTTWGNTFKVPVVADGNEVGIIDVEMEFTFLPNQQISYRATTNYYGQEHFKSSFMMKDFSFETGNNVDFALVLTKESMECCLKTERCKKCEKLFSEKVKIL